MRGYKFYPFSKLKSKRFACLNDFDFQKLVPMVSE